MSIAINDLNFSYQNNKVLHGINLCIERSETLTILGPNGSGKTTLLNIITGFLTSQSGTITYDGELILGYNPRKIAEMIGYVPQIIIPAFDYSVLEYVVTGCAPQIGTLSRPKQKHYDIAMKSICYMGIEHLKDKSYRQISGGERQQVLIARVLAQSPSYILMDEPTSNLDYGNQIHVLNTVKQLANNGYGVVFTTHNPDHALLIGGKVAIINRQGCLVFGNSSELVNENALSELYGVSLRITNVDDTERKVCFAPKLNYEETSFFNRQ